MQAALFRSVATRGVLLNATRSYASKGPKNTRLTGTPPAPKAEKAAAAGEPSTPPPPPAEASVEAPNESSVLPSLDIAPMEEEPEPQRTGARSSKDSLSSIERKRRVMGRISLAALLLGAAVQTWYLGREWEEDELKDKRMSLEIINATRWGRTTQRFKSIFGFFTEPLWEELLPPPLPAPHQKPMTLLVSIDDLLVTSTWDRQHGWRTAKRPGVDYFLAYLSQFYEIVIFTTQYHYATIPVLEKLDPYQFFIAYKLFRDATRSVNGQPVKDLTYLNRDLSKVILLDTHPEHCSAQPENAIIMPKWTGDPKDRGLVAMIPFLESIGIYKPGDVRPILESYRDKDIPLEYAKTEAAAKLKHIEEHKSKSFSSSSFTLSGMFGGSSGSANSSPVPLTYLEQKRLEAQMQYKEEQAYIAANKDNFEKLIKQEQDEMAKAMPSTFWGAAAAMMGPPPGALPPPDAGSATAAAAPATSPSASPAVPTSAPTAFGVLSGVRGGETKAH
ncbi:mitochondrial inner membrane protein required for protein import [Steccherinum ochraceum]|uniref:Mitochondrial import inner membrane translocase subunit TIM50 n=1 Tax=Steccherinum ochraceum TaxID=92696 RepID=A0A4V2MXB2_9APHY|nr:mitochondrial inner membrane protein required for protein import [Steccherinum ochraceum]